MHGDWVTEHDLPRPLQSGGSSREDGEPKILPLQRDFSTPGPTAVELFLETDGKEGAL